MDNVSTVVGETQWTKPGEYNTTTNPSISEVTGDNSNQVATVVIFVITAILVIILIFISAVFIDCRQQKIQNSKAKTLRKRTKQKIHRVFVCPTLSTIGETSHIDDQRTIVDNMYTEHTDVP